MLLRPDTRERRPVGRVSEVLVDPTGIVTARWWRRRPPRWVSHALLMYLASRLLVALAVVMALGIAPPVHAQDWWERWDSFWYLQVARHGYPTTIGPLTPGLHYSPLAFFPLWPLLIRATGAVLGGHPVLAAYLLNFVLGAVLTVLVRKLFAAFVDERTADLGVLLFVFFPGTNIFSAAYSEPLALCLAVGALLALQKRAWVVAGVLAGLAGATRPPIAVAVLAAVAWAVLAALYRRREWRALLAVPLAPLGLLAFMLYGWRHTGHPLAWHDAEKLFGNQVDFGRSFFTDVTRAVWSNIRDGATGLLIVVFIGIALLLVLAVFAVRRPPPAMLLVYTVVALAVPATDSALMPKVRFLVAAFPLFLPVARYLAERRRELVLGVVVATEGALLVGMTMMHLLGHLAFP